MLTAEPSTKPFFFNVQTRHMLTAQPSTYDMFALIEEKTRQNNPQQKKPKIYFRMSHFFNYQLSLIIIQSKVKKQKIHIAGFSNMFGLQCTHIHHKRSYIGDLCLIMKNFSCQINLYCKCIQY